MAISKQTVVAAKVAAGVEVSDEEILESQFKEVDINDTSLYDGVEQEIDAKEDWQAKAAPPPKGRYRLQIFPTSKQAITQFDQGTKQGYEEGDATGAYYRKELMCKIVSEDQWKGSIVGYKVSTGVPRGHNTSSMAGLMVLGGVKLPARMTDRAIASLFAKWLAKEPILIADCDWSAWDSSSKDKQNPYGVPLLKGMDKFPKKDGKAYHIVKNKKGEEFVATLKVVYWRGRVQAAAAPAVAPIAVAVAAPAGAPKPVAAKPKPVAVPVVEDVILDDSQAVGGDIEMGDDGEVILEG